MTQIGLEMAQIGVPHWPYRHPPGVRVYASKGDACLERGDHAESAHLHCCHLHLAFSSVCECGGAPERPPTSFTRLPARSTPSTRSIAKNGTAAAVALLVSLQRVAMGCTPPLGKARDFRA